MGTAPSMAYPNGRCDTCGFGLNDERNCTNLDCSDRRYGLTRDEQETDKVYVNPDGVAWQTPDGEGRIYYDTEVEAILDTGIEDVVYLDRAPEDY